MATQKPYNINLKGTTVDAKDSIKVSWQSSGDMSVAFEVRIYRNQDNNLLYDSGRITSFAKNYSLPAFALPNGYELKVQVTIWDSGNNFAVSDTEIFQTSSRPNVLVSPIGVVNSRSYEFSASYTQTENVPFRSWIAFLYDKDKTLISQSNVRTSTPLVYLINYLKSGSSYFIEFQATSNKGSVGTSGLIPFSVSYLQPDISINLEAKNIKNSGIQLSWKTIQIIGNTTKQPIYLNGEKLDLRDDVFTFTDGFHVDANFTLKLWLENIKSYTDLLVLKGQNGIMTLQYWDDDQRFHLFREVYNYRSHYSSQPLTGNGYFLCIQQIGGDMNIFGEVN
ncbi:hypothetical protein PC41400_14415 [Paenibacillus chitinolyticus]|uniref:Uncharacterized protein n=1 Tax=Paenibacillus chitinolyticus TaxID=79263 RepID=A0A410WX04_9BACL|nr:hypothetical protein [Paenibacillus chitinolyticus]MCY9598564.1 hypothetical protein [Paenibacillus chitinolyticus]QAV18807.1 hypothetical protein PC41400_14415 [Paenibacillus chitinolyticus]